LNPSCFNVFAISPVTTEVLGDGSKPLDTFINFRSDF